MIMTILVTQNSVIIGGVAHTIDCSALTGMNVVQWNDTAGTIEYVPVDGSFAQGDISFTDLAPFQSFIDQWNVIDGTPPPPPPPPPIVAAPVTQISRRQLILMLLQLGYITSAEAVAAATVGAAPAIVASYIASLPTALQTAAQITWASMSVCDRDDPMFAAISAAEGLTSAQVDGYFATAATL